MGLRAVAGLVDAYVPLRDRFWLEPMMAAEIQGWLRSAIENQPHQERWHGAAAVLAEALEDVPSAAQHTIRQWQLEFQTDRPGGSALEPTEFEVLKKRALLSARKPATYRAAYDKEKQDGDWIMCSYLVQYYLSATLDLALEDFDSMMFVPVVQSIRETAAGLCGEDEIAWSLAEGCLDRCRKVAQGALARPADFIDLTPDIDRIKEELIEPRRSLWNSAHGTCQPD